LPRTKTRKRITPRPAPARNFEEAHGQIRRYLRKGQRATIMAYVIEDRSPTFRHGYHTYSCRITDAAGKQVADLDAQTPAKLVAAFLKWRDTPPKREAPPFAAEIDLSKRSMAPVPARNESRSSSGRLGHDVPKLAHQLPLLTYSGD
jgi:hypothetical protein